MNIIMYDILANTATLDRGAMRYSSPAVHFHIRPLDIIWLFIISGRKPHILEQMMTVSLDLTAHRTLPVVAPQVAIKENTP